MDDPLKETPIGPMPRSWDAVPLHSLVEDTETVDFERDKGRLVRYVDVSSVSRELLKISESQSSLLGDAPGRARKVMRANDVIFATIRPTLLRVAHVPPEYNGQICSTAFCVLRDKNRTLGGRFIYFLVQRPEFLAQLEKVQSGASYPAVTDRQVKAQLVPLPPNVAEQEKIAALLLKAQRAVEAEEALIAATRELKRAVMRKLFTEGLRGEPRKETPIGPVPESWAIVSLSDICEKPQYGLTASASAVGGGPRFLRITDIEETGVNWNTVPYCSGARSEFGHCLLRDGDIVIARIGATTGKNFLIKDPPSAVFASYLIRVRAQPGINADFLSHYFNTEGYWTQIDANKGGKLKGGVNASILADLNVPLPKDSSERTEIATILNTIDAKLALHERRRVLRRELFRTLLNELMTGKTRVHDLPIDTAEVRPS